MKVSMPVPFEGSTDEKAENYASHHWSSFDDEVVCMACDTKPWHISAFYPCGTENIPRYDVEVGPSSAFRFVD